MKLSKILAKLSKEEKNKVLAAIKMPSEEILSWISKHDKKAVSFNVRIDGKILVTGKGKLDFHGKDVGFFMIQGSTFTMYYDKGWEGMGKLKLHGKDVGGGISL